MGEAPKTRRSIKGKLDRLVLISVGGALILTGLMTAWQEADRYLSAKRETLLATAQVFGAASSEAVGARDRKAVVQAIRAIGRVPGLIRAEVEDASGNLLAEMGQAVRLSSDIDIDGQAERSTLGLLSSRTVEVSAPIVNGGETVGRIRLVSDTSDLADRVTHVVLAALLAAMLALAFGLVLSRRLQRSITKPLAALAAAMASVERTNQYAPVTGVETDDETGMLARRFNSMIGEIRKATDEMLAREDEIIARLSRAGEQRDDQTGEHVVRVAKISRIIAQALGRDAGWTNDLVRASPMHDVGKISVPDAILFKPGRLDPDERSQMERHAEAGHRVLAGSNSPLVQLAAEIAITHHEKWDGTGYPNKIAGEAIPISGRITAVADVCDALLSRRPYKEPWTFEAVKAHLVENAGQHFDPSCVEALVQHWSDLEAIYSGQKTDRQPLAAAS